MQDWLAHPAIHAGVLPLLVALAVATALYRSRLAWLAVVAGYATVVALTTGFAFSPLTVSRKVLLLVLLAPLAGLAADALPHRARLLHALLATGAGLLSVWVFITVLAQRDAAAAVPAGAAIAAFVGALVWLMLRLRDDGAAAGAAGLGLGLAVGIAALLSASLGYFGSGVAVAAACGALLLVQLFSARLIEPGFTGTLPIGLA
ncbi:MAG TPA: hypothetical protein VM491_07280, partial [Burkholderiaceae bacterium]|nr:hypothetical protein [Burkholderiaceae bacterium]